MKTIDDCKIGHHSLINIMNIPQEYDSHTIIRWCSICGAVVGDTDVDGRIHPGHVFKMMLPKNILDIKNGI